MLLAGIGEKIPPSEIEVYTAVGLGAFWLPREKLLFFSSIASAPDKGISRALRLLGFDFKETAADSPSNPPYDQLRSDLEESSAVLGPLDMGFLGHNPLHKRMGGADHFVLAYAMDERGVSIHDPEGFPSVHLPFPRLEQAWRAEKIPYHRGYYRYWTRPNRSRRPAADALYTSLLQAFREVYSEAEKIASAEILSIDGEAILTLARHVKNDKLSPAERGFMVFFSLKLGARRALDFASFLEQRDPELAELKRIQSRLFGQCQSHAVQRDWNRLAESLTELADTEKKFRDAIMDQ